MIRINNINKYYNKGKINEVHVINNISLEFGETGLVCILGESGSGKTTLINTVGGLDDYKGGVIEAYGHIVKNTKNKEYEKVRNNNYGYIFQNYYLLEGQTVYANIKLCLNMFDINEEEKEERINTVLQAVGMEKYKKRIVNHLSGGQQQRVAIARALVKSPNVIFADEPTGNLDEENTLNVMGILKKISMKYLVIVVTHEKDIANIFADRIIEVSDGKIISDNNISENNICEYINDDNDKDKDNDENIYLKEYNKYSNTDKCLDYNFYNKSPFDKDNNRLRINIIQEDEKYYINSDENVDIVVLNNNSHKKIVNSYKPKIDDSDTQPKIDISKVIPKIDFDLEKLKQSKMPSLNFKQIISLAINNIKLLRKKQLFLVASLLIMSILVTLTINDFIEINSIDKGSIVKNDSHYLTIEVIKDDNISRNELQEYTKEIYDEINNMNINSTVYINNKVDLNYTYRGFFEFYNTKFSLYAFNFVPLDFLNEEDLVYGRLPKYPNEIVMDVQVAKKFMKDNTVLSLIVQNPKSFIDKDFYISRKAYPYKVVGISKTDEAALYIEKVNGLGTLGYCNEMASLESVKAEFPEEYKDVTISEGEILSKNKISNNKDEIKFLNNIFKVKSDIIDDIKTNIVISENDYEKVLKEACCYLNCFNVYTTDKQELIEAIKELSQNKKFDKVSIIINDNYEKDLTLYRYQRKVKVDAKKIIIFSIMLICLVVLYYIMKSNTLNNIKNISVYRLLGIKKSSITMLYIVENIIISTYTTLIGVLLTSGVFKFLASIPSLELNDLLSWYVILGTILGLYVLNILIGLLPIRAILKLMPAQMTAKYDL